MVKTLNSLGVLASLNDIYMEKIALNYNNIPDEIHAI